MYHPDKWAAGDVTLYFVGMVGLGLLTKDGRRQGKFATSLSGQLNFYVAVNETMTECDRLEGWYLTNGLKV